MCAGAHLANRELYVIFTRLILAFHILPTSDASKVPELDTIECNSTPTSMVMQPKAFKVRFVPRDEEVLRGWVGESLRGCEGL